MKGKLFLIVGPSGSGKSTVMMGLKESHPEFTYPISATTRPMREGEKDGDIYHFLSKEDFEKGIEAGDFLEYATVHQDHYYGTMKQPIMDALEEGKTLVREVDIQGFDSIREILPAKNLVTIFITAPSKQELIERIMGRATISEEELEKRLESMHREFARAKDCDYMVENKQGEMKESIERVTGIIDQESQT
jgi:guanylate kinase